MSLDIAATIKQSGHSVQFRTAVKTTTATGSRETSHGSPGTAMDCWRQPASAALKDSYGARGVDVNHVLYLSTDPGVSEGDLAVVGGETYVVVYVLNSGGLNRLWRVDLEERR